MLSMKFYCKKLLREERRAKRLGQTEMKYFEWPFTIRNVFGIERATEDYRHSSRERYWGGNASPILRCPSIWGALWASPAGFRAEPWSEIHFTYFEGHRVLLFATVLMLWVNQILFMSHLGQGRGLGGGNCPCPNVKLHLEDWERWRAINRWGMS